MKPNRILYVILVLILPFIFVFCSDPPREKNGLDILAIIEKIYHENYLSIQEPNPDILAKYKIKTIGVKASTVENNELIPSFLNFKTLEYNKEGFLIKQKVLDKKGKDKNIDEYSYKFDNGNEIEKIDKMVLQGGMAYNEVKNIVEFSYDQSGNIITSSVYFINKTSKQITYKATYNRKSDEIKINYESQYDMLSRGVDFVKIELDDDNNSSELTAFMKEQKNPEKIYKYLFSYDRRNRLSNLKLETFDNYKSKRTRQYEYDDAGLLTKILFNSQYENKMISGKAKINYNNIDLPIEIKSYDMNMNLKSTIKIEYNFFND